MEDFKQYRRTQIAEMRLFCLENNYKCIMASSLFGNNKNQLMLSKWKNGTGHDAIEKANNIKNQLVQNHIVVDRVKVESIMSNAGVPLEPNDDHDKSHYFEYHIKTMCKDKNMWNLFESICTKFKKDNNIKCGISFNAFHDYIKILVTIRVGAYHGKNNAEKIKDNFIDYFKLNDVHFNDEIQKEFSIYDTNESYDDDWL